MVLFDRRKGKRIDTIDGNSYENVGFELSNKENYVWVFEDGNILHIPQHQIKLIIEEDDFESSLGDDKNEQKTV